MFQHQDTCNQGFHKLDQSTSDNEILQQQKD